MKKTLFLFVAAGLMLATPSCKKGENDPALSLSSRKARVAGDWVMSNYAYTGMTNYTNGDVETDASSYATDVITNTSNYTASGSPSTTTTTSTTTINEATWTFEKDGTYSAVWNTTRVSSWAPITGFTNTTTTVSTSSVSGNWSFIGKVKDAYKKKERMVMNTLISTGSSQSTDVLTDDSGTISPVTTINALNAWKDNYYSGENAEIWEIDQLKGKEMIIKMESAQSGSWSSTPNGGSTTTTADDVETGELTVTLTAVK